MLEVWEARRLDHVLGSGRTKPALIECVLSGRDQNETRMMVVKALGPSEVTETGLAYELFGNLLARELGVRSPECALVNISLQVAEVMRPRLQPPGFTAGFGVGSDFMRGGLASMPPDVSLLPEEEKQAARLYAFDLLVQNPDRRKNNPNCAFMGKDIFAFDFELCFSFMQLIFNQHDAWEVSQHGICQEHIFHKALHKHIINWKPFVEDVSGLTEAKLMRLVGKLPLEWQSKTDRIRTHLLSVAAHPHEFEMELQRRIA